MLKKLLFLSVILAVPTAGAAAEMKLLIPMYFYPHMTDGVTSDPDWLAVAAAAEQVNVVAIVNIGNGLQDEVSEGDVASYLAATQLLDDAGVKMIGYVSSDYACNSAEDIKARIDQWHEEWPLISGIFVDETQNKLIASEAFEKCPASVPEGFDYEAFYKELGDHIHSHERFDFSVFNPGTDVPDELVALASVTVSFENTGEAWITDSTGDSQAGRSIAATHFSAMAYNTGAMTVEQLEDWITEADNRNYGWIHLTDDNGWGALPTYMDEFVAALWCHNTPELCDDFEPDPEPGSSDNGGGGGALFWLPLLALPFWLRRRTAK